MFVEILYSIFVSKVFQAFDHLNAFFCEFVNVFHEYISDA